MPSLVTLIDGTVPVAADFNGNYTALNNAIGSSTTISAWTTGEIPYASATNTLARLAPGSIGKVLTMGASVPGWEGGWQDQAFSAGDYTAGGSQTWTVASGDVEVNRYMVIGKTMFWTVRVFNTTVGGTPDLSLRVAIPGGKTLNKSTLTRAGLAVDNGSTVDAYVDASTALGTTFVTITKLGANWTASTDNTNIYFQIFLEIV